MDELGILSEDKSLQLENIIALLWKEARLDDDLMMDIENPDDRDVESTSRINSNDLIELGLLKLALFGVSMNQPSWSSKYCLPCGSVRPTYDENSWIVRSKMRRANGELVRHDSEKCLLCKDLIFPCPHSTRRNNTTTLNGSNSH